MQYCLILMIIVPDRSIYEIYVQAAPFKIFIHSTIKSVTYLTMKGDIFSSEQLVGNRCISMQCYKNSFFFSSLHPCWCGVRCMDGQCTRRHQLPPPRLPWSRWLQRQKEVLWLHIWGHRSERPPRHVRFHSAVHWKHPAELHRSLPRGHCFPCPEFTKTWV